jgi:ParB family transcriptional regulator, chromosome partitioning protein
MIGCSGSSRITNSKDLRKLRAILPDPVAKAHFLADAGDLESAALRLGTAKKKGDDGLSGELDAVVEAVKAVPWTALQELKGNSELLKKIEDAEAMLSSLRKALSWRLPP